MGDYLPSTKEQQQEMLEAIGLKSLEDLYAYIPKDLILKDGPNIPDGKSEIEVRRMMTEMASKNKVFSSIFRGAGAYHHYIPAEVSAVVSKETFVTSYTPYQPEMSQGILQSIFEYQTMICELTGMDVSNASVYDGANAAAEAVAMCKDRKRTKTLVSGASNPDVIDAIKTYCWAADTEMEMIPVKDGVTDLDVLKEKMDSSVASVYIAYPNYFGILEDAQKIGEIAHEGGAKYIMGVNPIASAIIKTAGECGADIAVGEGQPLGMGMGYGGPYLGFMASTTAMLRKLPGRIAGETTDDEGRRAFVLTLQAREQHIRREKASSNVCSNQALCAMTAAVYMATMGPEGMKQVATQSTSKAHYLASKLDKIGFKRVHQGEFFHEFVTSCPGDCQEILRYLEDHGVLGGLPVEEGILWCTTEMNTKADMDHLVALIGEVCQS
ncbi:MAG TPA: aminomethyl-transferring glycine dehydrogenase subunit GcvPA [Candidatus Merdenecus merdavium]|nr:aminomethyl-transferring glycine dehydrogenase subunit GcvPA [Candidatus Merdenecus merdavium]